MARSVYDVAAALSVMTGVDPADESTKKSEGRIETDYTKHLDAGALDGARIGMMRDFMEQDSEVDWIVEASLQTMRDAGATIVDVKLPKWLLDSNTSYYWAIRYREFRAQVRDYLSTTGPAYPKSLDDLVRQSMSLTAERPDGMIPNPGRWKLMLSENDSGELGDYEYIAVRDHGLPLVRGIVAGMLESNELDAIVYPTSPTRPERVDPDPDPDSAPGGGGSPVTIANLSGFPDLIVPAGFTGRGLPVTISFLGPAFSEPRLLALGYAFEQIVQARRLPDSTPPLDGERISW
jgi:amidase